MHSLNSLNNTIPDIVEFNSCIFLPYIKLSINSFITYDLSSKTKLYYSLFFGPDLCLVFEIRGPFVFNVYDTKVSNQGIIFGFSSFLT